MSIAAVSRTVDLSRSTFEELVNSGRIGLIRSRSVRTALAEYDRWAREFVGFWEVFDTRMQDWAHYHLSYRMIGVFREACGIPTGSGDWEPSGIATCPFELGGWSADALRAEFLTPEVQKLITYQTQRAGGTMEIAGILRVMAEDLKRTLTAELAATGGGR